MIKRKFKIELATKETNKKDKLKTIIINDNIEYYKIEYLD